MIVDPIEAQKMRCCVLERQCMGPACMAWKRHLEVDHDTPLAHPLDLKLKDSGKGYCGMAYPPR